MALWETLGISSLLIGGLTFIAKLIIDKTASLQFDKLKAEHQRQLDELKHEHQTKFSQIYQERYTAIKEMYQKIDKLTYSINLWEWSVGTGDKNESNELLNEIINLGNEIIQNSTASRIYFKNNELPNKIEEVTKGYIDNIGKGFGGPRKIEYTEELDKVTKLKVELEKEFRSLIH